MNTLVFLWERKGWALRIERNALLFEAKSLSKNNKLMYPPQLMYFAYIRYERGFRQHKEHGVFFTHQKVNLKFTERSPLVFSLKKEDFIFLQKKCLVRSFWEPLSEFRSPNSKF